jgi:two-component system, LytTR family, response regulator
MKLRTVVVDDEPLARERMLRLLAEDEDVEVVAECGDGRAAVEAIRALAPDLVLLDVQMPEMDGFAVVRAVGAGRMPRVVFVTAHDRYALQAFEVHALDYLLKPFLPERLRAAVRRAARVETRREADLRLLSLLEEMERERHETGARVVPASAAQESRHAERLLVKQGERMIFVPVERVDWLEAEGNYVRIHAGKERHLVRATMNGLEAQLDPARFLRIHRSTIVNLDRVCEVRPWFAGDCIVVLHDGRELRLSRRFRDRLDALLAGA